jgi:hypothetical protein
VSHSSRDSIEAPALKTWLERAEPGLVGAAVVDLDPETGIPAGVRWKEALRRANDRCEAVICLVSKHWDAPINAAPSTVPPRTGVSRRARLRSAAHPHFSVETGLRIWPRLRPTDRLGRG